MSGLGRFLEEEGIATVQISLVREHTETMKAPRALFVPFMLGRPLGVPDDAAFQRRVLKAALGVLEAPEGPVIIDYAEEAPAVVQSEEETEGWVCPISFGKPDGEETLTDLLAREIQQMRVWYEESLKQDGRTTVGVSGLEIEAVGTFLAAVAEDPSTKPPRDDLSYGDCVKYAVDDLKAFMYEAAAAQPGTATPGELDDWYWGQSASGQVVKAVWRHALESEDPSFNRTSRVLVPHPRQQDAAD